MQLSLQSGELTERVIDPTTFSNRRLTWVGQLGGPSIQYPEGASYQIHETRDLLLTPRLEINWNNTFYFSFSQVMVQDYLAATSCNAARAGIAGTDVMRHPLTSKNCSVWYSAREVFCLPF